MQSFILSLSVQFSMDLWNNEIGRQDGINATSSLSVDTLRQFLARWNNGGLIQDRFASQVTSNRRSHIWSNSWDIPVR